MSEFIRNKRVRRSWHALTQVGNGGDPPFAPKVSYRPRVRLRDLH
jgi:hypothetical protein